MPEELIRGRELAQKIYTQITRHPETHAQHIWLVQSVSTPSCGTKGCIAGWAVALNLASDELAMPVTADPDHYAARRRLAHRLGLSGAAVYSDIAAALLGLTFLEGEELFYNYRYHEDNEHLSDEEYAAEWLRNHFELEDNA